MHDDILDPKRIRLADGREFSIATLLSHRTRSRNYNLRRISQERERLARPTAAESRRIKYTIEDRIWQASAEVDAIVKRYSISQKQASLMRYQSRYILDQLDIAY